VAGNIGPSLLDTLRAALVLEGPRPQVELPLADAPELEAALEEPAAEPTAEPSPDQGMSLEQLDELDELLDSKALPIEPPTPRSPEFAALPQVWVLELSSFQLDEVQGFEPTAATVLNLSQDHLD